MIELLKFLPLLLLTDDVPLQNKVPLVPSLCDPDPYDPPEDWARLGLDLSNKDGLWRTAKELSASWLVGNFEDEGDHMLSPFSWQAAHARIQMDMMTGKSPAAFLGEFCPRKNGTRRGKPFYCGGWGDRIKSAAVTYKLALLSGWGYFVQISHPYASQSEHPDNSFLNAFVPKYSLWNTSALTDSDIEFIEKGRHVKLDRSGFKIWNNSDRDMTGTPIFSIQESLFLNSPKRIVSSAKDILLVNHNRSKIPIVPNKTSGILVELGRDEKALGNFLENIFEALTPWYVEQLNKWNTTLPESADDLHHRMLITQIWSKIRLMLKNMSAAAKADDFGNPPVGLDFDFESEGRGSFIGRRSDLMAESCLLNSIFQPTPLLIQSFKEYSKKILGSSSNDDFGKEIVRETPTENIDVEHPDEILPVKFITADDIRSFPGVKNKKWLIVGLHIRGGDTGVKRNGRGDARFKGSEAEEIWKCILSTVRIVTERRCRESLCPWDGVKIVTSSDQTGEKLIKSIEEIGRNNESEVLVIGPEMKIVEVQFVNLARFRASGYVHVRAEDDDDGYRHNIESLSEMLILGNSQILIRSESGLNYVGQLFGGVDSSFTSSVSVVHKKVGRMKFCSPQVVYFGLSKTRYPRPKVLEPDIYDFYEW